MRGRIWFVVAAAAGLLIVIVAVISLRGTEPPPPVAQVPPAAPNAVAAAPAPALPVPSFDVVTVDPQGHAVIAGRAAPGDRVEVLDGKASIGEVTADQRGDWVLGRRRGAIRRAAQRRTRSRDRACGIASGRCEPPGARTAAAGLSGRR
jgi:hypothetical protein